MSVGSTLGGPRLDVTGKRKLQLCFERYSLYCTTRLRVLWSTIPSWFRNQGHVCVTQMKRIAKASFLSAFTLQLSEEVHIFFFCSFA